MNDEIRPPLGFSCGSTSTVRLSHVERVEVPEIWSPHSVAAALRKLPCDRGSYWSPHQWREHRRRQENWIGSCGVVFDLDYHDDQGKHVAVPGTLRDLVVDGVKSGAVPASLAYGTPRGVRVAFLLSSEPVTDREEWALVAAGAHALLEQALREHHAPIARPQHLEHGLHFDLAYTDIARFFWAPSCIVPDRDPIDRRDAPIVESDRLFEIDELQRAAPPEQSGDALVLAREDGGRWSVRRAKGGRVEATLEDATGRVVEMDTIDPSSSGSRNRLADRVAKAMGADRQELRDEVLQIVNAARQHRLDAKVTSIDDGENVSQATRLVELAQEAGVEPFRSAGDDDTSARFPSAAHHEVWPIRSTGFKQWLRLLMFRAEHRSPNAQALTEALDTLDAQARFDGEEHEVHVRVAGQEGRLYLDLCNDKWEVVEVRADGWRVLSESPVRFVRSAESLALPTPDRNGSLEPLWSLINAPEGDVRVLIASWLLGTFHPKGPFPILFLQGEQGSAKSTTARALLKLVDPARGELRSAPREERDLVLMAKRRRCVAYDNLSWIPEWLSDALCRIATGACFATRKLYTDDDELVIEVSRPVLINGIEELASRSDLLDRAIVVELPRISEERRMEESLFWRRFDAAHPLIFAGILDVLVATLGCLPRTRLERPPRMADFARWATAAEVPLGFERGSFMRAYGTTRAQAHDVAIESVSIGPALLALMEGQEHWRSTATQLLKELRTRAGDHDDLRNWPKTGKKVSGLLRRLAPNLRAKGIELVLPNEAHREPGTGARLLQLRRRPAPGEEDL